MRLKKKKIQSVNEDQISYFYYLWIVVRLKIAKLIKAQKDKKNPHKSFQLTPKKESRRPLSLPSYTAFTKKVLAVIFSNWRVFLSLITLVTIISILTIGLMSQDFLNSLNSIINETSGDVFRGNWGEIGKASLILLSTATSGGLNVNPTDSQKIIIFFIILFVWLVVVWMLRNILAERKFKLRDALYNCGYPIVSTFVTLIFILIQAVPILIAIIIYSAAVNTRLAIGGVESMIFFVACMLLVSLSIFWIVGSVFAIITVTLPETYPMEALFLANNIVMGRKLKIFKRLVWMFLFAFTLLAVTTTPFLLLFNWLGSIFPILLAIPIVPFIMLVLSIFVVIFIFSYVYLLYREIVEYDNKQ